MLTAEGCFQRRKRFWERLDSFDGDHVRLADPIHVNYLTGFSVDPISLHAPFGAVLLLRRDGRGKLLHDNKLGGFPAHVEERTSVPWYDGESPGIGPRRLALLGDVRPDAGGVRVHDRPGDPAARQIAGVLGRMRRQKDADEVALLRRCMKAGDAGHAWARENVKPGMTELDVYSGISTACVREAGKPVVVYGDFAVSPGPSRAGGPPTSRVLQAGDMMILDFSVVIDGYRGDFTNTLVVGAEPRPEQQLLCDLSLEAMAAGESYLKAGAACRDVYQAVEDVFAGEDMATKFGHHAGHGLGLTHPEAPFFVRNADETLLEGDVVTLEPGLYVEGTGGLRIERNYLITAAGFETLSGHVIALR